VGASTTGRVVVGATAADVVSAARVVEVVVELVGAS